MAQVTVGFEDYQYGSLPDVCVFTGAATDGRMVLRTPVRDPVTGTKPAGRLLGSFDRAFDALDPRRQRNMLVGRLPIERNALRRRLLERRTWKAVRWAGFILLVLSAWVSASWSPFVVIGSIVAIVVAGLRSRKLRENLPSPTLIGAGTEVHLQNVHEGFVAAVEHARRVPGEGIQGEC